MNMNMMSDNFMYTGISKKRLHDSEDEEHEIDSSSTVVTSLQQKMKRIRRFVEKTYNRSIVNNNFENEENLGTSSSQQQFSSWRHPAQSPLNNNYQGVSKQSSGQVVSSPLIHSSCECDFEPNTSCTGFTVNSSSDKKKMEEIEFCFDGIVPSPRKCCTTKSTAPKVNGKVVQSIFHEIKSESNQDRNIASNSQCDPEMEAHRSLEHRGGRTLAQVVLTNGWQCKNAARRSNRSETFPWTSEQIDILDSAILSFRILPRSTVGKVFRELKSIKGKNGENFSEDHVRKWLESVNSDYSVRCRFAERQKKLLECDHARGAEPKTDRRIRFNEKVVTKIINED